MYKSKLIDKVGKNLHIFHKTNNLLSEEICEDPNPAAVYEQPKPSAWE